MTVAVDQSTLVASIVVSLTAVVVLYDGWRLTRMRTEIPTLGAHSSGGYAWQSDSRREVLRNTPNLATIAVMMALPWPFVQISETPIWAIILFDALLALHSVWLMAPKRYAVTQTHLFADGFHVCWSRLRWAGWSGGGRIVLHRKGWWVFAPLPLGGEVSDLEQVARRIEALENDDWGDFSADESE